MELNDHIPVRIEIKANNRLVTPKRTEAVDKDKLRYALNGTDRDKCE